MDTVPDLKLPESVSPEWHHHQGHTVADPAGGCLGGTEAWWFSYLRSYYVDM